MGLSKAGSSQILGAKTQVVPGTLSGSEEASREKGAAPQGGVKQRKLIAYQTYFGLEAGILHAGAKRALERMSAHAAEPLTISVRSLGEDFGLDSAASGTLLRAFLAGGLLYPDGNGGYYATTRFREYAFANSALEMVTAMVAKGNDASFAVARNLGMEPWRDDVVFETECTIFAAHRPVG